MYLFLKEVIVGIIYLFAVSHGYPINSNTGAAMYLHKYGYLQDSDGDITAYFNTSDGRSGTKDVDSSAFTRALRNFQKFYGLHETGKLDEQTLLLMNKIDSKPVRSKRYVLQGSEDELINPIIEDKDEDEDTSKMPAYKVPNLCEDPTFDTITRVKNGITYIFKGEYYWKYLCNDLAYGYPRNISEDWDGLEGNLDASFTLPNGRTFFFKGNRYWRFTNKKMDKGYPKLIGYDGFEGIPPNLDAALVWNGNQQLYLFKGDKYWRYDFKSSPSVSKEYPLSIKEWEGLPLDGINGAVSWENNVSYFFKGDKYYRFDDVKSKVPEDWDPPYPLSTAEWWFNC